MPRPTFFALPAAKRGRLVREAIVEFADRPYAEASLSQIAARSQIAKGSFYQYFDDKLDLYAWLLTDEAARQKRAFLGAAPVRGDFWARLEAMIERGMAFLVENPRLARLTAAAADPTAQAGVRGLHRAICEAGVGELRGLLAVGVASGAIARDVDLDVAARLVSTVIGPGLTDVVLAELGAELHEILSNAALLRRLGPARRRRLAREAVAFLRGGLAPRDGREHLRSRPQIDRLRRRGTSATSVRNEIASRSPGKRKARS